jgi:hypothetical protein
MSPDERSARFEACVGAADELLQQPRVRAMWAGSEDTLDEILTINRGLVLPLVDENGVVELSHEQQEGDGMPLVPYHRKEDLRLGSTIFAPAPEIRDYLEETYDDVGPAVARATAKASQQLGDRPFVGSGNAAMAGSIVMDAEGFTFASRPFAVASNFVWGLADRVQCGAYVAHEDVHLMHARNGALTPEGLQEPRYLLSDQHVAWTERGAYALQYDLCRVMGREPPDLATRVTRLAEVDRLGTANGPEPMVSQWFINQLQRLGAFHRWT